MSRPTSIPVPAFRLLFAALLLAPALSGCSLLAPFDTCEGTEAALAELAALPALELRPPRATPVAAEPEAAPAAHCVDDTGDAWLTAERLYVYEGSRAEVLEYYGREAPAAGWHPVHELGPGAAERFRLFCFESEERPSLTLDFPSSPILREVHLVDPGPESTGSGPRTWFAVSTESGTDGSPIGCSG